MEDSLAQTKIGPVADVPESPLFENPFTIEDLQVFDDATLPRLSAFGLTMENLAWGLHGASRSLIKRIRHSLPVQQRSCFTSLLRQPLSQCEVETTRRMILDRLFWELTYWKTPELYEELTEGEQLHPAIFEQLESYLCEAVVLDAAAGTGRASFECLQHGARLVYAVEPSPGLLRILERKVADQSAQCRIVPCQGRFDKLPLADNSVDVALSCSAFTADSAQGGECGLAELKRVTKPGGKIVLVWPRTQDHQWLAEHGFQHVVLPISKEMCVHFHSLQSALRCAQRFYAHNTNVIRYILKQQKPVVPFSVLGLNPPCDYCWLQVT